MKKSIAHLPEYKQEELRKIIEIIREELNDTQIIILFGSYAKGKYVEYDQRTEYGVRTCFKSDFDLLVLTPKKKVTLETVSRRLTIVKERFYGWKHKEMATPIQFVNESVEQFNKEIREGRYFFTEVLKTGIILYNSGNYEIETIRPLDFEQILKLAEEYYNEKYQNAEEFLDGARYYYSKGWYKKSSFELHQAVENYMLAIILTSSLYSPKEHDLYNIFDDSKKFTDKAVLAFPRDTEEDERLFKLLNNAYVQGRYNKDFLVTNHDLEQLFLRTEKLRIGAKEVCLAKIEEYKQKIEESKCG